MLVKYEVKHPSSQHKVSDFRMFIHCDFLIKTVLFYMQHF